MKKTLCFLLTLSLALTLLCAPALAAAPSISQSSFTLYGYPGGSVSFSAPVKNWDPDTMIIGIRKQSISDESVVSLSIRWARSGNTFTFDNLLKPGKATVNIVISLDYDYPLVANPDGSTGPEVDFEGTHKTKTFKIKATVYVADNFAPRLQWKNVQLNEETGYPQLKIRMTDDFGLSNVCFVRKWTDENGAEQSEIYDIISLYDQTDATIFRTLDKPGEYSLQINDTGLEYDGTEGAVLRNDTKVLITLVDTDSNGVADAYFTDDPGALTALDVEGGVTPAQTTVGGDANG